VEYSLVSNKIEIVSNIDSFVVDKIVDVKVNWQDSQEVAVASKEKNRVLTFNITNLGNGDDNFTLEHISNGVNSFEPKPINIRLYFDSNANGVFDSNDTKVNELALKADENATLFILADIEDTNYTINQKDDEGIKATSKSLNKSDKDSQDSVDIVVRNKSSYDYGTYIIRDFWLESKKSSTILSDDNKTHTGTIIEYKIALKIGGNSENNEINNIKLKDVIANTTTYVDGSLKLNGTSLSDAKDSDAGYYENNEIVVTIPKITGSQLKEIKFKVKVN